MAVLDFTEQGAVVRKTGERRTILMYGNYQATTPALAELLDPGIELASLSRSGRLREQLTPPKAKNIPDDRRHGRVAHALKDYGDRVQLSVFECNLENESLERRWSRLPPLLDENEDSVRIYRFRSDCGRKTEILGRGKVCEDPEVYVFEYTFQARPRGKEVKVPVWPGGYTEDQKCCSWNELGKGGDGEDRENKRLPRRKLGWLHGRGS